MTLQGVYGNSPRRANKIRGRTVHLYDPGHPVALQRVRTKLITNVFPRLLRASAKTQHSGAVHPHTHRKSPVGVLAHQSRNRSNGSIIIFT